MGPLAAVERFLERLFERQSARLFKTAIRPVQVQRRLERVMEGERVRDAARTVVPHRFVVRLHPDDLRALRAAAPALAATLADGALGFARSHGYTLLDRPVVAIRGDTRVAAGDIAVDAAGPFIETAGHARPGAGAAAEGSGHATDGAGIEDEAVAEHPGSAPPSDRTAVFVIPAIDGPRATLREIRADRSSRAVAFDGRPLTIGRSTENGLVLRDGRASRHHARIDVRRGSLVLTDLGSTNGSFVNDRRVESIALGEGDRIRIGTTTLLVEAIEQIEAIAAVEDREVDAGGGASGGPGAATSSAPLESATPAAPAIEGPADGAIAG